MKRVLFFSVLALFIASNLTGQAPTVNSTDWITDGRNFDAAVANDKIYLISDNYYELDLDGNILYTNSSVNDIKQGVFDFHPAIDVGTDDAVHVIHRRGDNTSSIGFELNYSKREAGGTWAIENKIVGTERPRNYVVDVVAMDNGEAVYGHTRLTTEDVDGQVYFYRLYGNEVDPWGSFGSDSYYRVDADFRMARYGNTMHLATGQPDPTGKVFYMNAPINSSLPTALAASADQVLTGGARSGMPDLKVDNSGRVFITSGDGDREEVNFERFSAAGSHQISNKVLLSWLGTWHLDLAMSAMATSTTGDTILVTGLVTGGDPARASSCAIRYLYSFDAGSTWSSTEDIPNHRTHSCEGRNRPRIHFYNHKFYVFYNNTAGGIAMTTIQFGEGPPPPPPVELVDPVELSLPKLSEGLNFDVEVDNKKIYLISDHYYEYNLAGELYAEDSTIEDSGQSSIDFGPALAVGSGGEVHVITRNGGNGGSGFNLFYSNRLADNSWAVAENSLGTAVPRNYVVDVVALDGGDALFAHSTQKDATDFGPLSFYTLDGTTTVDLGDLGLDDLYKTSSDFRMERYQDSIYLASGKPYVDGTVYYMKGNIGSLITDLTTDITELSAGNGVSGQPDLRISDNGHVFVSYGSEETVLFNRYSNGGASDVTDTPVFDNLGSWHLDLGLSAIETSPDGDTLLAVGLKTDGTKEASNSSLYYSYSLDGGENWVYPIEISGFNTNAGEGRMRPRVRYYSGWFYIFFNNVNGGIAVKTINLAGESPSKATTPTVLPAQDSLTADEFITIESTNSDAIYYSFADSTPDMLSTKYATSFNISSDTTFYAVAYRSGYLPSDVITVSKKLKGDPPPPVDLPDPIDLSISMLAGGKNFDVEVANDRIYLISDRYYEFDLRGDSISGNLQVIDEGQGTFDFGPAISVGPDGIVHVITRQDGLVNNENKLMYSKRLTGGTWAVSNNQVGFPAARNYVVDVVAMEDGSAIYAHSQQTTEDVYGSVFFYTLDGTSVSAMSDLGRNDLYRINGDFRMERYQNEMHLATSKPDNDGAVYYMDAAISPTLPADLASGPSALLAGTGERGMPDLGVDESGNVFITYGAYQTVYFKKYANDGSGNISDTPIFSKLGAWHLDLGLSAIATSPSGDTLLAVGIKTDGSKEASDSKLLYTFSLDGGITWVYPTEINGFKTNAGEGRMRPRIKYYRERFYIFFNNVNGGISVKTVDLRGKEMIQTTPPVILPDQDTVAVWDEISIQVAGSDAIYYSLTDTDPDILSTKYINPFYLDKESTIYARAYRGGYLPSDVVSRSYKFDETPPLTDPVDLTKDKLCNGTNFDVEVANDKIYIISDHYYEFDLAGELLEESVSIDDQGQGTYDFSPAIAIGDRGEVHIITRGDQDPNNYIFNLKYSKKDFNGTWPVNNKLVGTPESRNYVVDVVALDNGKALYSHSQQTTADVYSSVFFYTLDGSTVAPLGDLGSSDFYRIDADYRMERFGDKLHLATGSPDPDGTTFYMNATIGPTLPTDLASSSEALKAGEGRRGQPDLRIDDQGNVFISYGSKESVFFNRYSNDGSGNVADLPLFSGLGSWHLDLGLSALASTPSGDTLMAVALETDGSVEASNCGLHYTYSFDGGRSWVYPYEITGYRTNGGEGRMRPRVKFYRGRFYIFYNNLSGGIAVTTIDLRNLVLLKAQAPVILPEKDSVFTYETLSIEAVNSNAIYYSFLETNPDIQSTLYEGPFTIDKQRVIFARAYRSGYLPSDVVQATKEVIITSAESQEELGSNSMDLYPVPASTNLIMESVSGYTGEVIIRVFNHTGQVVYLDQIQKSSHVLKHEIDVGEWTGGVYFMVLQSGPDSMTRKFVVE